MTMMVCFHVRGVDYCMPVSATRSVGVATDVIPLPMPRSGIVGIIPGDPPLTIVSPLGPGGTQILVVETSENTFGLLVDEVTALRRVTASQISPSPRGQDHPLISGTVTIENQVILMTDPDALGGRL